MFSRAIVYSRYSHPGEHLIIPIYKCGDIELKHQAHQRMREHYEHILMRHIARCRRAHFTHGVCVCVIYLFV